MQLDKIKNHLYPYTILDIGANVGQFHNECKIEFPSSYIFSIEASSSCEAMLRSVTKNYKICLLGKENEMVDFYTNLSNPTSTGNSIYREMTDHFSDDNILVKKMSSYRLDDIFKNQRFDLIKIDTQGSEIDIIKGGLDLVSNSKGIILEVSISPYNEGAPLHDEVVEFMDSIGFDVKETLEEHINDVGFCFQIDYLFVNRNYKENSYDPIYNITYSNNQSRDSVINYIKRKGFKRVIDIGASANSWSSDYITHYLDIVKWENTKSKEFLGNICSHETWASIIEDVNENGKFDFVICSHTLEDISSPLLVNEMINLIGKEGFIAMPSKNMELTRNINGPYLGWVHHRWIYDIEDKNIVAYPKLNFIETLDWSDIKCKYDSGEIGHDIQEIRFFWKNSFNIKFVNGDYMGPDIESVYRYFDGLKK